MRITQLTAENVKRLQAVQITPDGAIVQITGKNGAGKSSVLDSIAYALGGKDQVCAKPVRNGAKKARVICQLDDLTVTRTFTPDGGGTLTVASADGAQYPSPQAVLNKLVGKLTLDPLEFSRMQPLEQLETLKALVGLDFSEIERERAAAYTERTLVNRNHKAAQAQAIAAPLHVDVPETEESVAALMAEIERRRAANQEVASVRSDLADAIRQKTVYEDAAVRVAETTAGIANDVEEDLGQADEKLSQNIARLQMECDAAKLAIKARYDRHVQDLARKAEELASASNITLNRIDHLRQRAETAQVLDVPEVQARIASAESTNRKIRENRRRAELDARVDELAKVSKTLTDRIEQIDADKQAALSAAAFPISDLSFDESGVIFKGVPFAQASSAEQLRASVAIGLAMNPKLRVLLIRDGSLLDADGLKMLAEMAEERDAQIWIERVEDGGNVGVVIEDGCVKQQELVAATG